MVRGREDDYRLVPVAQCIYVAENNLEKPFRLFLLLKFLYPEGKARFDSIELAAITQTMQYADARTVKRLLKKLQELKWLRHNGKTGFYQISAFPRLRRECGWLSKAAIECRLKDVHNIEAVIGTAIFTYLHKVFWRKVGRDKVVRIKGRTFHSLSPHASSPSQKHAPIASTGVNQLYRISISKASRLKTKAHQYGWLQVQKSLVFVPEVSAAEVPLLQKYYCDSSRLIVMGGRACLQRIDLVLPLIPLRKRQN